MSINPSKRKCSAVSRDGHPCQAWAMIDSDPALCSAHAGRATGAGAPNGNQNAMKHGLYAGLLQADEIANLDIVKSDTVLHELVLARVTLRRLARYLEKEDLPLADLLAITPLIFAGARAVAHLQKQIENDPFEWDDVLDELGEKMGIDI